MTKRMTEKEKMLAGEVYSAVDPELLEELMATREVLYEYNSLHPSDTLRMKEILKGLLGHVADDDFLINQPFRCDYGKQISIGKRFFANFNFTVLDEARVTIGDDCFIGPNVSLYTACHSTDPVERNSRQEWAEPITIGNNVWIGGSVTILPGVTIGDNVTIGAGSVVVNDIPSNTVAVGNPCRVIDKGLLKLSLHLNNLRRTRLLTFPAFQTIRMQIAQLFASAAVGSELHRTNTGTQLAFLFTLAADMDALICLWQRSFLGSHP